MSPDFNGSIPHSRAWPDVLSCREGDCIMGRSAKKDEAEGIQNICRNKRAFHEYEISEARMRHRADRHRG